MPRTLAAAALGVAVLVSADATTESASERATDPLPERLENELRVHFYNVGAGTCTLVECPGPNARPIIVDCGKLDNGQGMYAISDEALRERIHDTLGARSPDVVLSHSDTDHVSLIPGVLDDARVGAVWQGDNPGDYPEPVRNWVSSQQAEGAAFHGLFAKDWHNDGQPIANGLDCGTASSYVLTVNSGRDERDDNADSLVLMVEYGSFRAIFTGDATGATERAAIANFDGDLRAAVLSASHHGASSKGSNSADWAHATQPAVVIYSAGTLHGHPRCAARDRLRGSLAKAPEHNGICRKSSEVDDTFTTEHAEYMTRVNGAITVTTNGESPLRLDCEIGPGCAAIEIQFE